MSTETPSTARRELDDVVLAWMSEWGASSPGLAAPSPDDRDAEERRFDELARRIFAFQYQHCDAYARFCDLKGASPREISSWREIPAVPTGAFKEVALRCFPESSTCKVFRTSGTTGTRRGELHLDTLALYENSLLPTLQRYLLVEPRPNDPGWNLQILAPDIDEAPDSSLSHMFSHLRSVEGSERSAFRIRDGALQTDALRAALARAAKDGEPVVICGTAFAFVHWLDELAQDGESHPLPAGSRVMETGGFKGRSREIPRSELYGNIARAFAIPESSIVNQYGMTELGSQFYDSVLADPVGPRRKLGPPWARVRVIDPEMERELPAGETGILVISDLANTGSVAAIQTADLGRQIAEGFEVIGREPLAEARGCSIAVDWLLENEP